MIATQLPLLGAALVPYVVLVSIDAWMHEASRKVPRVERWLHYSAGALFLGFLIALFRDATGLALALFGAFVALTLWDAIGFHRDLDSRERRVHLAAYAALAMFVCIWGWLERTPSLSGIELHLGYAVMVLLGFALMFAFPLTGHFPNPGDRRRYYAMQAITAVCALLGAKLAVLFGDALWPLREFHDWDALIGGGRSIAGALLFGFLGVEAAKPLLRYDIPPNDRFAIILPFSIGLGRIGCLIVGCCRGEPWDGPWAITYADGIPRHPAPVYEMIFHWAMGFLLIALWRRQILFGRLFALYLLSYGVFRFLTEFLRETPKAFGGLSAYQIMSLLMIVAGALAIVARTWRQPASWERWKTPAAANR